MSRIASLPLFVDDFEAATAHLTLEEDGAYNRLLRLCWRQSDCTIPNDEAWIMRRMRCDADTFSRVVLPILDEFFTRKNGRVFQKRLSDEHAYVKKAISARKKAGSKGGKSRALKNNKTCSSKAQANVKQNSSKREAKLKHPSPSPSPSPDVDAYASTLGSMFDQFWGLYPRQRRGNKDKAKQAYLKALKENRASEAEILHGVREYAKSREVADKMAKGCAAWLNDDRWACDYSPPKDERQDAWDALDAWAIAEDAKDGR